MENPIPIFKELWPFIKAHPYLSIPLAYLGFLGLRWYASRMLGYRAFFKRVRDLDPSEFIGKYQEYYYRRNEDKTIEEYLQSKTPLLITGMPMAGKTRAAYEAIKRFSDHYILYPYPTGLKDLDFTSYRLLPLFRDWLRPWRKIKVILLLNDLPEYTKGIGPREGTDRVLALINSLKGMTNSFIIVATSRSQEAEALRRDAPDFLGRFEEVKLEEISEKERQEIEKNIEKPSGEFDGTIGSILLGKGRMRDCLRKRGEEAQAIMWSIGLLLMARIIPPEEGLARTVCEKVFGRKLDPVRFNNIVTTLRSDGLVLRHFLLPGHPSYVEKDFLNKDLSIQLTDLKDILKERRRTRELHVLAEAFYYNKDYAGAVEIWEFILSKIDSKDALAWNNKGWALVNLGRHQDAIDCCDKALEFDPRLAQAWSNKGVALGKLGRPPEEELNCYNKALEIDPRLAMAWVIKGVVLGKLGRPPEDELECYKKALEIDPRLALAWSNKGRVLGDLGRHKDAIECFDKALEIDPRDAQAWWLGKGVALERLGRPEMALNYYDKAIEIDPRGAQAWDNKGTALGTLGRYQEALDCYNKALEIDPRDAQAWLGKGAALGNLGRCQEDIECFDKALEIDPKYAEAWYNKGAVLGKLGKHQDAIDCFDKALEINPKLAQAWLGKGVILKALSRNEEAKECFRRAKELGLSPAEGK